MGVTFNIIIITHATMCYCCEAPSMTKLEIDLDAAISKEFGRTNPRQLKMANILQGQFIILFVYYSFVIV